MKLVLASLSLSILLLSLLHRIGVSVLSNVIITSLVGLLTYELLFAYWPYRAKPYNRGVDSVLITDGSNSIGQELSKCFARDGFNVILVSKNLDDLKPIGEELVRLNKNILVHCIEQDLRKKGSANLLFEEIQKLEKFRVNHLINNSDFRYYGEFPDTDLRLHKKIIKLNMKSLLELTYRFSKWMKEERTLRHNVAEPFRILNVSSFESFLPAPYIAIYGSIKAFIQSFSLALHEELKPFGIHICTLSPNLSHPSLKSGARRLDRWIMKMRMGEAKDSALLGYKILMENRRYAIAGFWNNIMIFLYSIIPYFISSPLQKIFNSNICQISQQELDYLLEDTKEHKEGDTFLDQHHPNLIATSGSSSS